MIIISYFIKQGNTFRVAAEAAIDLHHTLPVGNYIIKIDPQEQLYLEQIDSFEFKSKLYGDNEKYTKRILNTFFEREVSTGIMLAGEKGSGKSLLAKTLAIEAAKKAVPTIVINSPFTGDKFNKILQDISQPCIVLFDEFEKVYDRDDQEEILTLLDGVFPSKKLFVLTCNDKWRIDSHMRNRPGRIYYMIDFKGLDAAFIVEYCNDNLNNKSHIEKICAVSSLFNEFNFDMLKALVEEMNRYNESPQEALVMLNAKPEFDGGSKYTVVLEVNGKVINSKQLDSKEFQGNPMSPEGVTVGYDVATDDDEDDTRSGWNSAYFDQSSLQRIEPANGVFVFANGDNEKLTLTKLHVKEFNFNAF